MTQVETLRAGKWNHQMATVEEVAAKVEEIRALIDKYGWLNRNVHPYGYPINIQTFMVNFRHYREYTPSSKHIMLAEINGLIKIINEWIKQEEAPKVTIRFLTGKHKGETKEIPEEWVEDYIDCGLAERV